MSKKYTAIRVEAGKGGWGGPLVIQPTAERDKIVAITGGGIPAEAKRLAELTGGIAVDGFKSPPVESEICCVVIDCGGTARCGVYPRKRIPTVNLTPVGQSGPLAQFITEDIYVSGVKVANMKPADGSEPVTKAASTKESTSMANAKSSASTAASDTGSGAIVGLINSIGRVMGSVVNILFSSGRRAVDQVIRNVIPFMAFVTMMIGIINYTGVGNWLAHLLEPLAGNIVGLLILSAICGLPFLSPVLGPGAVIAQVIGAAIIGPAIGNGAIPPAMALPALFAYNTQVGCDFVPVGLALGEAKPETIQIGVPAVLISRQIMGPVSVIIAYAASFLL